MDLVERIHYPLIKKFITKSLTMKQLVFLIIALVVISCNQSNTEASIQKANEDATEKKLTLDETTDSEFNKQLAEALEADKYGMKQYVMAFLKKGPNRDLDSTAAVELQKAHMNNISRLAKEGKLVLAGPFIDDGDVRGIYIFDVKTIAEAKKLTETDPAIKAGSLTMELRPWYGSAALLKINEIHKTIAEKGM